jgi:hypothetical protein
VIVGGLLISIIFFFILWQSKFTSIGPSLSTRCIVYKLVLVIKGRGVIVFNATFNNISVTSWRSILLMEETGENHLPFASHWQTLSYNVVSCTSPPSPQQFFFNFILNSSTGHNEKVCNMWLLVAYWYLLYSFLSCGNLNLHP